MRTVVRVGTPMTARLVALAVLACATLLPGAAAQQGRVIPRADLARLRGDSARPRQLTRVAPGRTDTIARRAQSVRLSPGQLLAVALDSAPPPIARTEAGGGAVLPFRYLSTDRDAATIIYIRPVAEIEPLTYQGAAREFRGVLHLGLEDSLNPARSRALSAPIAFLLSADRARVTPASLSIQHTNLPFAPIQLAAETPGESIRVHIRPAFNPRGVDVLVTVERPAVTLEPVTSGVAGFGLAVAIVHVTLPLEAGSASHVVRLRAGRAIPEPSELALSGGETKDGRVRSVGVGADTLYAESAPFRSDRLVLPFLWPLHFLLTSLVGGVFGSVLAGLGARRRGQETRHGAYALGGLGTGLFVAVAFAVGLNLTGLKIVTQYGEAVIVIVSALGAIFGLPGLGRAVPALGRALAGARLNAG
jgi:hypothetical protein